jgi:hypothetical protein
VKVELWLKDCANSRIYEKVENVFQEANLLCIEDKTRILKYPISNVFRIVEYK